MAKSRSAAPTQRQLRVGEEIRHVLSGILATGDLRDPDLAGVNRLVAFVAHDQSPFDCRMAGGMSVRSASCES